MTGPEPGWRRLVAERVFDTLANSLLCSLRRRRALGLEPHELGTFLNSTGVPSQVGHVFIRQNAGDHPPGMGGGDELPPRRHPAGQGVCRHETQAEGFTVRWTRVEPREPHGNGQVGPGFGAYRSWPLAGGSAAGRKPSPSSQRDLVLPPRGTPILLLHGGQNPFLIFQDLVER